VSTRSEVATQLWTRLGGRRVLWFGTRGEDGVPILDVIPDLVVCALTARSADSASSSLEEIRGSRMDLDSYDLDADTSAGPRAIAGQLVRHLAEGGVVVPYRSSRLLSDAAAVGARFGGHVLSPSHHAVASPEYKPWVEQEVRSLGIPTLEWHYIDLGDSRTWPAIDGPVVIRPSTTSGGRGISIHPSLHSVGRRRTCQAGTLVAVSRFLENGIPLNVAGVVWIDGVTVHPASVQLIGVPELTSYDLGYCGNDFAATGALGREVVAQIESVTRQIGAWLHRTGYRGAFGLDLLLDHDRILFVECNPRFQGSTFLSSQLAAEISQSCSILDHLAAWMGVPAPRDRGPLSELVDALPGRAQAVLHNLTPVPQRFGNRLQRGLRALPQVHEVGLTSLVPVEPGGVFARILMRGSVLEPTLRNMDAELRVRLEQLVQGHPTEKTNG